MRNANYYQSVVRQYFESDTDKYKDAFMAKAQTCDDQNDQVNSGRHECFCNFCGDDITNRSKNLAQNQFDKFKAEFLQQQQSLNIKQVDSKELKLSQKSPNTQINEDVLNEKIEELTQKHNGEIKSLKMQLQAHMKGNVVLSEKIQQYKVQQYISEQNIDTSQAMQFLQDQALKLVKTIEIQRGEINQLKLIKSKYETIKIDKEKSEAVFKKNLEENQTQITSQNERYQVLYRRLEGFQVDIAAFKERISKPKEQTEDANMIDSNAKAQNQSEIVISILKELKSEFESDKQKEEIRKKYEYYKKQAISEKSEKDAKIKELQIYKDQEGQVDDVKDMKAKLETLKINHQKEYTQRKDKEMKLEQVNGELQKKNKSLEDILSQIDQIFQANAQYEEQISTLEQENTKLTTDKQLIENKQFQVSVELLQSEQDLKTKQELVEKLNEKLEAFKELAQIDQSQNQMQEKLQEQLKQVTLHFESEMNNMDAAQKALIQQQDKLQSIQSQTNSKDKLIKDLNSEAVDLRTQNTSYKSENSQQKKQIQEIQSSLKKAQNSRDQGGSYDKNDVFSKNNELDYYKYEYKKYKKLVNCSICDNDPKEIVLPCGHMLCEKCMKKQFQSRMRFCPIDRKKFSDKQPLKIFLNDACDQEENEDMQNFD